MPELTAVLSTTSEWIKTERVLSLDERMAVAASLNQQERFAVTSPRYRPTPTASRAVKKRNKKLSLSEQRECPKCHRVLSMDSFHKHRTGDREGKPLSRCKECSTVDQLTSTRKRRYGISLEAQMLLHEAQNGKCAICGQSESVIGRDHKTIKQLAVDHDHITGKVRGLLCGKCNIGLGYLQDDPGILANALRYVSQLTEGGN